MINIVGKRYLFFGLSLLVIIPGLIFLALGGLKPGIDFTGGSLLEVQFKSGVLPPSDQVISLYNSAGFVDTSVQTSGNDLLIIRSSDMTDQKETELVNSLQTKYGNGQPVVVQSFETVGPSVGKEVATQAGFAVGAAAIAITLYITIAFRGVENAFRYGLSAIIAMFHDILVVIGVEAMLGKFLGWEADSLFLTALLTVIGFSVHDTIVVFDRIRENAKVYRRIPYETLVNHSIVQTLDRSINTQMTVMITLLALTLFGGITIRHFVLILLIGVFSGTYSSIFNAASILVVWENREWKRWFRRREEATPA
jgi:preprotein translocase subunit SecF